MGLSVLPLVFYLSGQLSPDMSCLWPGYKFAYSEQHPTSSTLPHLCPVSALH